MRFCQDLICLWLKLSASVEWKKSWSVSSFSCGFSLTDSCHSSVFHPFQPCFPPYGHNLLFLHDRSVDCAPRAHVFRRWLFPLCLCPHQAECGPGGRVQATVRVWPTAGGGAEGKSSHSRSVNLNYISRNMPKYGQEEKKEKMADLPSCVPAGSRSGSPGRLLSSTYGRAPRSTMGTASTSVTDKSRPRGHRSQGCSRETSPTRSGTGEDQQAVETPGIKNVDTFELLEAFKLSKLRRQRRFSQKGAREP